MLFVIINADDNTPEHREEFVRVQDAVQRAGQLNEASRSVDSPFRYRISKEVNGTAWKQRENARILSGEYTPTGWEHLPWFHDSTRSHYPHLSTDDTQRLAYTASAENGTADRQTVTTPGRYLAAHYGEQLSPDAIELLAANWRERFDPTPVSFAYTPDDIADVFENGPQSCMGPGVDFYNGYHDTHPCSIYGYGDLAVAYTGEQNNAVARVVCWPEKKVFTIAYPVVQYADGTDNRPEARKLSAALENMGWTRGSMIGAKCRRVECAGHGFVVPYLDSGTNFSDCGTHLEIDEYGPINGQNIMGTSGETRQTCEGCGYEHEADYLNEIEGDLYCSDCSTTCGECLEFCLQADATYVDDSVHCEACTPADYICCSGCFENRSDYITTADTGEEFCNECQDDLKTCGECGNVNKEPCDCTESEEENEAA